ncbi:MAG: PEP-CTERM sorting domain-containing protein [Alphaproteobacteria bacterium]|nr:PEP-CTERM sorting domain-containing protein [Alphaproteobacteria bacterium]
MRNLMIMAGVAAAAFAVPAAATDVTTFANFSAKGGDTANFRWQNGANTNNVATNQASALRFNASFFTIGTNTGTTPGSREVKFTFLQDSLNPFVNDLSASFTMNGTVTGTVATLDGSQIVQTNLSGSFSFTNNTTINFFNRTFAPGSNLLSGTFSQATLSGNRGGTSGGLLGSTPQTSISYTSDFLTFVGGSDYDMSFGLNSITTQLVTAARLNSWNTTGTPDSALRSFRALANGQFSSNPAPIAQVPEPGTWAMMIAGMGLVGFARRRRTITVAA